MRLRHDFQGFYRQEIIGWQSDSAVDVLFGENKEWPYGQRCQEWCKGHQRCSVTERGSAGWDFAMNPDWWSHCCSFEVGAVGPVSGASSHRESFPALST